MTYAVSAIADGAQQGIRTITGGTLFDVFLRGGPLMWPILACSIVALAFIFERLVGLRASAVFPRLLYDRTRSMVQAGDLAGALDLCARDGSFFARLLSSCLSRSEDDRTAAETALEESGSRILYDLRKNARPLGVIADVSPLLGLMGTVLGMIKAFEVVATTGALGRAERLAGGIAEALITTGFGLTVAVPALIFYHYFRGKADSLLRAMEDACLEIVDDARRQRKDR